MVSRLIIFIQFLLLSNAYAFAVKIPTDLAGAKKDALALMGKFYQYEVKGKVSQQQLPGKLHKTRQSVEEFFSTMIFLYNAQDVSGFKQLLSPTLLKNMTEAQISQNIKKYSNLKNPTLDSYFQHNGGQILAWSHEVGGKVVKEPMFIKKTAESYLIHPISITADDMRFFNIGYFMTYKDFKKEFPTLDQTFKNKKQDITFKSKYPYITLLKKSNDKWILVANGIDNFKDKYSLHDHNPKQGEFELKLYEKFFESDKNAEYLIINSTYPFIPKDAYPESIVQIKF